MNKLKLGLLAGAFTFLGQHAKAQQNSTKSFCGSEVQSQQWEAEFQRLIAQMPKDQTGNKAQTIQYTIPVIVHVIHGGQPVGTFPNIAQGQIVSQIMVLNNDFAGTGYNTWNYPNTAFSAWAATQTIPSANIDPTTGKVNIGDCGVQFCLATKDTLGNILPEPGIDRINYVSKGWTNPAFFNTNASFKSYMDGTIKPQSIWNVSKYMNIWVTDVNSGPVDLLGYATFPTFSGLQGLGGSNGTPTTDGFWCYGKSFGSIMSYSNGVYYQGYNRGRVASHEIGHYLGLRHIWGDGNCVTDYCVDTPPGSSSNFGGPTYPFKTTACAGNSPNGEMFMNIMDYTDDAIKYMFTTSQAERVQTVMLNSPYRKFLGTHNLCSVEQVGASAAFIGNISACTGVGLTLNNQTTGFPFPTFTWSATGGTITPGPNAVSPVINFSTPGQYVVMLAADNGTLSVFSKTITVTSPLLTLSTTAQTVCPFNAVTLTADGSADTFTWQPGGLLGYAATYTPTQSQTYTCNSTEGNGCTSTATISLFVSACTGLKQLSPVINLFNIYPNPAKELLNIAFVSDKNAETNVEIIDALGKTVLSQNMSFAKDKQGQALNISSLSNGVYFVKLRSGSSPTQFIKLVKE